jgi:hypothetical protein
MKNKAAIEGVFTCESFFLFPIDIQTLVEKKYFQINNKNTQDTHFTNSHIYSAIILTDIKIKIFVIDSHVAAFRHFTFESKTKIKIFFKFSKSSEKTKWSTYPPSLVPNSSNKSVNASRNSIIPWAGIAICDRGPPRVIVCDTWVIKID